MDDDDLDDAAQLRVHLALPASTCVLFRKLPCLPANCPRMVRPGFGITEAARLVFVQVPATQDRHGAEILATDRDSSERAELVALNCTALCVETGTLSTIVCDKVPGFVSVNSLGSKHRDGRIGIDWSLMTNV